MKPSLRYEDLKIGDSASIEKVISEDDILTFAELSGDTNPVHLDEEYAQKSMFKGRIAHGMLTAGLISSVLGTRLPGPGSIYLSQSLKFLAPVRIGDKVRASATVAALSDEKKRVLLDCRASVADIDVLVGEAHILMTA